jgi:hypothetical protein
MQESPPLALRGRRSLPLRPGGGRACPTTLPVRSWATPAGEGADCASVSRFSNSTGTVRRVQDASRGWE